tara:strand:+ start:72 stop:476 length:405 start_codon:yes stop_codon:yes gene_type:complete
MITKFNHVAIAVPDLKKASEKYRDVLGAKVSKVHDYSDHGVSVVFIELQNSKIELMEPYGNDSPIQKFLQKNMNGGIHHICIEVKDINKIVKNFNDRGIRILGDGNPKIGAHNKPVIFLHPKEFNGTLIEIEQE